MNLRNCCLAILASLPTILTAGCGGRANVPSSVIENIRCTYTFTNVDRQEERDRVYKLIKGYAASDSVRPTEAPSTSTFDVTFTVGRLTMLDELHPQILFAQASGGGETSRQVFNPRDPQFSIKYDTINIGAAIEVIVRFTVTPGAMLYYKPEGEGEKDITTSVGTSGNVEFKTTIRKGQDYIYARTLSGNVNRYIKINVYTQKVEEIRSAEYPK